MNQKRIVVGVSGASGIPIAVSILKSIQAHPDYCSLMVLTDGALQTLSYETDYSPEEFMALADETFDLHDVGASISSGTFRTEGMIIAPCSMKTIAGIAAGYSDNLVLRAADVTMKERRPLVLIARESPLNQIHLRNMMTLAQAGAIIMPPMLTYYNQPKTIQDMTDHIAGKALDVFGLDPHNFNRWK